MFHKQGPSFFELAQQALSSTRHGYDLLAPKFDYTPFRTSPRILDAVSSQLSGQFSWRDGLDVCCGTGAGMELLAKHCSESVTGVDFSKGMLDIARQQVESSGPQLNFRQQDVLDEPLGNQEFDVAVCFGALGHVLPGRESDFIQNIANSLRPGGQFIFVTSTMPSVISPAYWAARSFNAAMHVRNLIKRPPFIMFYLTFIWPTIEEKLRSAGFEPVCQPTFPDEKRLRIIKTIVATKTAGNSKA